MSSNPPSVITQRSPSLIGPIIMAVTSAWLLFFEVIKPLVIEAAAKVTVCGGDLEEMWTHSPDCHAFDSPGGFQDLWRKIRSV